MIERVGVGVLIAGGALLCACWFGYFIGAAIDSVRGRYYGMAAFATAVLLISTGAVILALYHILAR